MNKIKNILKKTWKWLVALLVGGVAVTQIAGIPPRASVIDTDAKLKTSVGEYESDYLTINKKYKQLKSANELSTWGLTTNLPYDDIKVLEYVSPKGPGYQIILVTWDDGKISSISGELTKINVKHKSIGYGPEAKERTFDWRAY